MSEFRCEDWHTAPFLHGDQATCMTCSETIYFCQAEMDTWRKKHTAIRGFWSKTKLAAIDTYWADQERDSDHDHQPKQFCRVVPSREGAGHCGRHVKYEDQVAEIYACGHHRATETQAMVQREREEKRQREEARQLAITKYEIEQYKAMAQWLRDNGHEAILGSYRADDGYSYRPRLNRVIKIDLHMLYDLLRGGEDETNIRGEQATAGSVDGGEVPVHSGQPLDPFDD